MSVGYFGFIGLYRATILVRGDIFPQSVFKLIYQVIVFCTYFKKFVCWCYRFALIWCQFWIRLVCPISVIVKCWAQRSFSMWSVPCKWLNKIYLDACTDSLITMQLIDNKLYGTLLRWSWIIKFLMWTNSNLQDS